MASPWSRMIALADMNSFFAAVEQLDNPHWRGRPVGVTNGLRGSCIITSSYEARAYGVKTGMRVREAKQRCPHFIQAPARPARYAEVSTKIMASLNDLTPELEVFSVDEAFLDLTGVQHLYGHDAERIGRLIKAKVFEASGGLHCSVGLSGDKTTAKWAAKRIKPNGLTIVHPDDAEARLAPEPLTELCGVNTGVAGFFAPYGVQLCGDMKKIPISIPAKRFGNIGRRLWLMAQGKDPEPLHLTVPDPKSIGHGKVTPPDTTDLRVVTVYLTHMAEKVAARLRRHRMEADRFTVGVATAAGWNGGKYRTPHPTADGADIVGLCARFLRDEFSGLGVHQVHVCALNPQPAGLQTDLFAVDDPRRSRLLAAVDAINDKYGEFTVCPAQLIDRSDMPNVIAPAWKPGGHRDTIQR